LYLAGELKALAQWGSANGAAKAASVGGNGATPGGSGVPRFQSPPPLVLPGRPLHPEEIERLAEQIESWMVQWLVQRGGVAAGEIGRQRPFAEFGLDSLTAVELSQELEDWLRIELTPVIAWNYPTLATLSRYLAGQLGGGNGKAAPSEAAAVAAEPPRAPAAHDFERLLAEIETLSDEEAETALNRHATGQ
jgi:acyl carrier protein